jgi:hypothetical protein
LTQTNSSVNGLFADDATAHHSKVWKDQNGNNTPDHVLTVSKAATVTIGLQVTVNLPAGYTYADLFTAGQCLRVTAVFGRDHKKQGSSATYDSPFTIDNEANGVVCTVFDQWFSAASLTSDASVNLSFGTPQLSSSFPNNAKDQYAFIVAVTLYAKDANNNNHVYTAGHDPQMDIDA